MRLVATAALAAMLLAGCQADPDSWRGGLKYLNVHAVAFTAYGGGLVMVGPRASDSDQLNATAYYHLDLRSLSGRRLGYGQYSLGEAVLGPVEHWVAVPTYFGASGRPGQRRGYEVYDTRSGAVVRRVLIDEPELFLPHVRGPSSQPEEAALRVWQRIAPLPLTALQEDAVRQFHPRWISRGARARPGVRTEPVDRNAFYVLDSPDGKHRLYIRFNAPSSNAAKAANPDGEGYAYGFLAEIKTGKRFMLYTTTGADETLGGIGAAVIGGPVWLIKQPIKWITGR